LRFDAVVRVCEACGGLAWGRASDGCFDVPFGCRAPGAASGSFRRRTPTCVSSPCTAIPSLPASLMSKGYAALVLA